MEFRVTDVLRRVEIRPAQQTGIVETPDPDQAVRSEVQRLITEVCRRAPISSGRGSGGCAVGDSGSSAGPRIERPVGIRRLDNTRLLRWPDLDATENVPSLEIPSNASTGTRCREGKSRRKSCLLQLTQKSHYACRHRRLVSGRTSKRRLFYLSAGAFGIPRGAMLGLMMLS